MSHQNLAYQKLNHPWGDEYENWLAKEQAQYYKEVIK